MEEQTYLILNYKEKVEYQRKLGPFKNGWEARDWVDEFIKENHMFTAHDFSVVVE